MLNNNHRIAAWIFLILALAIANSKDYISYTPPSPVQSISNEIGTTNDYQGLIKLQEAFVRNAKAIKPAVVSINKVKEVIENSSWNQIDPNNHSTPEINQLLEFYTDDSIHKLYLQLAIQFYRILLTILTSFQ